MKAEGELQDWARRTAKYIILFVAIFMGLVSLWVPYLENDIHTRWFGDMFVWLLPIPVLTVGLFAALLGALNSGREYLPFIFSLLIFVMGFIGLAVSLWPFAVPYEITIWSAAAAPESLSLMLIGVVIMLPVILAYTGYCYYLFRGKVGDEPHY